MTIASFTSIMGSPSLSWKVNLKSARLLHKQGSENPMGVAALASASLLISLLLLKLLLLKVLLLKVLLRNLLPLGSLYVLPLPN